MHATQNNNALAIMSSGSKAPGPVLQWINELFHQEPYSFLVYGVYWFIVLSFLSPIAGVFLMFQTGLQFVWYLAGFESVVDPRGDGKELAVMITGCDSGFGQQLAFALAKRGYIVFAGCLRQEAMAQFEGEPNIVSMLMDVTKDDQVQAAAKLVDKWLTIGDCERERYLHAVVNNAGIGHGGLVDWLNLSAFQQDMDGKLCGTPHSTYDLGSVSLTFLLYSQLLWNYSYHQGISAYTETASSRVQTGSSGQCGQHGWISRWWFCSSLSWFQVCSRSLVILPSFRTEAVPCPSGNCQSLVSQDTLSDEHAPESYQYLESSASFQAS